MWGATDLATRYYIVSMKSGLEGRNNDRARKAREHAGLEVSMKSGLEGRNNSPRRKTHPPG